MNTQPKTPQRIALGRAIEQWEIAKAEVENLRQADARATAMIEDQDSRAMRLAGVEAEVAAYRAQRIMENSPAVGCSALPGHLDNRLMERESATERAAQYRAARAVILMKIGVAEDRVAACAEALHHAIIAVLRSEGDALARELAAVEVRASALRQQLIALDCTKAMLPGMAQIGDMQVSTYTGQVLKNPPRLHDLKNPEPALMKAWRDYYLALSADAAAGPPAADADGQPVAA